MEINRLSQDELSYELAIRDLPVGKVDDMRINLRAALRTEKEGRRLLLEPYPFTFEEDLEALKTKLEEIKTLIEAFVGDTECSEFRKITTKIEWAFGRLERTTATEEGQRKEKSQIRAELILALSGLKAKAEGEETDESDSSEGAENSTLQTTFVNMLNYNSRVKLDKWNIKFGGESGQSLNSFLDRVQELADARGVNHQQLYKSALDLFKGKALIWYRANKARVNSWSSLVKELKKEFLPADYDERLLEEIKRRTQGKDETMGMYIAVMSNMFSRMSDSLSETQKLSILKRNISPFYQTQLGLTEVKSLEELTEFGRRLEAVRTSVEAFTPPPSKKNNQLLEPDLAYVSVDQPSVSVVSNSNTRTYNTSDRKCFKCGNSGHIARFCKAGLRCFGCGKQGVKRPNCNNCAKPISRSAEQSSSRSGNEGVALV